MFEAVVTRPIPILVDGIEKVAIDAEVLLLSLDASAAKWATFIAANASLTTSLTSSGRAMIYHLSVTIAARRFSQLDLANATARMDTFIVRHEDVGDLPRPQVR